MLPNKQPLPKWVSFLCFLILILSIEAIGGFFTETSVHTWYLSLNKASWNPPAWVFGPVWTLLYLMIAVAGWLVFLQPASKKRTQALQVYWVQLILNLLWTYFFFFLEHPFLGFLDIIALFGVIFWMVVLFRPLSKVAAYLMIPYLLWVGYACSLNGAVLLLN